jgi:GABA(A) receptor-associated protein
MGYKDAYTVIERRRKASILMDQYPDRVPILIEPAKGQKVSSGTVLDKNKFLTPRDFTLGQLMHLLRKKIIMPPEKALFMFVNNKTYPVTTSMGLIYDTNRDEDGFLYITYCEESTFG